jgi:hypothetical protein
MTTGHTVVRSGKSKRKPFDSNVVAYLLGQLLFHLASRLYERTSIIVTTNPRLRRVAQRVRRRQDDNRAAQPSDPPLRAVTTFIESRLRYSDCVPVASGFTR